MKKVLRERIYSIAEKFLLCARTDDDGMILICDSVGCDLLVELAELRKNDRMYVSCGIHHLYPNRIIVSIA